MRVSLLGVGSRGDVEPLLALGLGLVRAGHRVRLATLAPFEGLVRGHGLEFASLGELPRRFTHRGRSTRVPRFRGLGGRALFWGAYAKLVAGRLPAFARACADADAIVFGGLAFVVVHVAEAMGRPCFWAAPAPHVATDAFANPFFGGRRMYRLTHIVEEQLRLQTTARSVNAWRRDTLGLPALARKDLAHHYRGVLTGVLCNFSAQLVPRPPDWPAHVHLTGSWPVPLDPSWSPSPDLRAFLDAGPAPVYIGFGSMSARDPERFARMAIDALARAGQRGLIAGLPAVPGLASENILMIGDVPHAWLFPRVSLVVHHGGAGTTAAAIRAGRPSIVIPFAFDQPFWAERLRARNAARILVPAELDAPRLAAQIRDALVDEALRRGVEALERRVAEEDGIAAAIAVIERESKRARPAS